jgi:gamma-glutamylcyclotransferase (GGCT)/AIG2-like uncharacterized protein YtfP
MVTVFVYGTLKQGFEAHDLLGDSAKFLGPAVTHERYHLYCQGHFPGMVIDEEASGGVHGELYEVTEETIPWLDRYEAVDSGLFCRAEIELADGNTALAYLYCRQPGTKVESGVWE